MKTITDQEIQIIKDLHNKYAIKGPFNEAFTDLIWTHSMIVTDIAEQIANDLIKQHNITVDLDLLSTGALLHDIGAYQTFDASLHPTTDYIQHGVLGYKILISEGYEEKIARFAQCHTGVGLTKDNIHINHLPLPEEDLIPITLEEELVCYADNFHTKSPAFCEYDKIESNLKKSHEENSTRLSYMVRKFGIPDLREIKKKYTTWHIKVNALKEKYADQLASL